MQKVRYLHEFVLGRTLNHLTVTILHKCVFLACNSYAAFPVRKTLALTSNEFRMKLASKRIRFYSNYLGLELEKVPIPEDAKTHLKLRSQGERKRPGSSSQAKKTWHGERRPGEADLPMNENDGNGLYACAVLQSRRGMKKVSPVHKPTSARGLYMVLGLGSWDRIRIAARIPRIAVQDLNLRSLLL